ncbi:MAG: hypothetical protein KGL10_06515 [Alphaproteobacteria bacterium]|nr:hypothetical protein [Alphaproteobacteria bacterium]MDE2336945.1 hypothetical protein [Alphaproteobacteria bacterium]
MALITLILLVGLSARYLSRWRVRKPDDPLFNLVDKSDGYLEKLDGFLRKTIYCDALTAFFVYSLAAALFTLLLPLSPGGLLLRFCANVLVALMLVPFVVEKAVVKYKDKINAAILQEMANLGAWVVRHEKYFSIAGCVFSVLLFFVMFR